MLNKLQIFTQMSSINLEPSIFAIANVPKGWAVTLLSSIHIKNHLRFYCTRFCNLYLKSYTLEKKKKGPIKKKSQDSRMCVYNLRCVKTCRRTCTHEMIYSRKKKERKRKKIKRRKERPLRRFSHPRGAVPRHAFDSSLLFNLRVAHLTYDHVKYECRYWRRLCCTRTYTIFFFLLFFSLRNRKKRKSLLSSLTRDMCNTRDMKSFLEEFSVYFS